MEEILTSEQTAALLHVTTRTLQKWRAQGRGPRHLEPEPNIIRYKKSDVEEWLESGSREDANG
jgi:predicted DNA-binding transcriptional regulator AlpA